MGTTANPEDDFLQNPRSEGSFPFFGVRVWWAIGVIEYGVNVPYRTS